MRVEPFESDAKALGIGLAVRHVLGGNKHGEVLVQSGLHQHMLDFLTLGH